MQDSIGDRFKLYYENAYKITLPMRMPVIIRLDIKCGHSLAKDFEKPYDYGFIELMQETMKYLCENVQCTVLGYCQSDEISLLLHNYKRLETQSWFGNELQKMVSVSAGLASSFFTSNISENVCFDSRVFVVPESEVVNYFIWRQKDWERNSIQMLAQSLYSHKELHEKSCSDLHEMCFAKGKNWAELPGYIKNGSCCKKIVPIFYNIEETDYTKNGWEIDKNIPIFTENRNYIEKLMEVEQE